MLWYLFILIVAVTLLSVAKGAFNFAPWVPTLKSDIKRVVDLIKVSEGDIFYDLGSGDGRVMLYLAKKFPQARFVGIETAWPLWLTSQIKKICLWRKNVSFKLADFFKVDLSNARGVYFFGTPHGISQKFREKLEKELKPGAQVVSFVFKVKGWEPAKVDSRGDGVGKIYLYKR